MGVSSASRNVQAGGNVAERTEDNDDDNDDTATSFTAKNEKFHPAVSAKSVLHESIARHRLSLR